MGLRLPAHHCMSARTFSEAYTPAPPTDTPAPLTEAYTPAPLTRTLSEDLPTLTRTLSEAHPEIILNEETCQPWTFTSSR